MFGTWNDLQPGRPMADFLREKRITTAFLTPTLLGTLPAGSLPVIAYGLPPDIQRYATTRYSFNLLSSFGPKDMRYRDLAGIDAPIAIIVDEKDELMVADRYAEIAKTAPNARAQVIPGVDHMGMARDPAALAAIVAAVKG